MSSQKKKIKGFVVIPNSLGMGVTGNSIGMNQLIGELQKEGVELIPIDVSSKINTFLDILRILKKSKWRHCRFILFNSSAALRKKESPILLKLAKLLGLRIFIYYHESKYQTEKLGEAYPEQKRLLESYFNDPKITFLANSEFTQKDNQEFFNSEVVFNGLKVNENLVPKNNEHLQILPPTIIQLSTIQELKDPKVFIETAKLVCEKIPDAQFLWLGSGPMLDECQRLIGDYNLVSNVFFPGFISNPDIFFRNCHIFFQTSKRESFSLTTAQAMAYGREIVMFKGVGGAEEVAGGLAHILEKRDPQVAADKIIKLLSKPIVLREDSMERFRENYDLTIHAKRIALILGSVLDDEEK